MEEDIPNCPETKTHKAGSTRSCYITGGFCPVDVASSSIFKTKPDPQNPQISAPIKQCSSQQGNRSSLVDLFSD